MPARSQILNSSETACRLYYYGARYYSGRESIWLGVDPKIEKYPTESPFVYCGNNPILHIDPDGKEKIIGVDQSTKSNRNIYSAAQRYNDDNAIHVFAHGNSKEMIIVSGGKSTTITNPDQMAKFLSANSQIWKNKKEGEQITLILHSCETGKSNNGGPSLAQNISSGIAFKDVKVIAPDEPVWVSNTRGEEGAYKRSGRNVDLSKPGHWRVFQNGNEISKFNGGWKPREKPNVFETIVNKEK